MFFCEAGAPKFPVFFYLTHKNMPDRHAAECPFSVLYHSTCSRLRALVTYSQILCYFHAELGTHIFFFICHVSWRHVVLLTRHRMFFLTFFPASSLFRVKCHLFSNRVKIVLFFKCFFISHQTTSHLKILDTVSQVRFWSSRK